MRGLEARVAKLEQSRGLSSRYWETADGRYRARAALKAARVCYSEEAADARLPLRVRAVARAFVLAIEDQLEEEDETMRDLARRVTALERSKPPSWHAYARRDLRQWPSWALDAYIRESYALPETVPLTDEVLQRIIAGDDELCTMH